MLTYEEALAKILSTTGPLPAARVRIEETLGMVVATGVGAASSIPPFKSSAMDGYAARYQDLISGKPLKIVGAIRAGDIAHETIVMEGQAAQIATGAQLPPFDVDTVVPVEDCLVDGDLLTITQPVRPEQCVRPIGQDIVAGAMVATPGQIVTPGVIAFCAAGGRDFIEVHRRPIVSIIATGSELVPPGKLLGVGQIYNSNSFAIAAQVAEAGGIVDKVLHVVDDKDATRAAFDSCAGSDVLITTGGVSVGEYDFVKEIFEERGTLDFWRVALRPGKPLAFGRWDKTLFFGLPGNPVSSMVTFELFARPVLRTMLGDRKPTRPTFEAVLDETIQHGAGRRSFVRGIVYRDGNGYRVKQSGGQDSGMLHAMAAANSLIIVPEDVERVEAGKTALVMVIDPASL